MQEVLPMEGADMSEPALSDTPPPPGYRTQSPDTSYAAERFLFARLRELPAWRKIEMLCSLNRAARDLALTGLRRRHPHASESELRLRLAALRLDRETVIRACGWDPDAGDPPRVRGRGE
jgi:hypothetical protein